MPSDRVWAAAVAWVVVGCAPSVRPQGPGAAPSGPGEVTPSTGGGGSLLLGEVCPAAAEGRAAFAPLVAHAVRFETAPDELDAILTRGGTSRVTVLGHDGARAGVFDPIGVEESALPQRVAPGVYVGHGPCSSAVGPDDRTEHAGCNAAARGCGLALAELDPPVPDREPSLAPTQLGRACVTGEDLAVDLDGDGAPERYRLGDFLDGARVPAERIDAQPPGPAPCTPTFSTFGLALAPGFEPGAAVDPKYVVELDVLGVIDLDRDGRREVIVAVRYPTARTVVVFGSRGGDALERLAEADAWM